MIIGTGSLVAYCFLSYLLSERHARRNGCQNPPKRSTYDPILGLGYKIRDLKLISEGKILPDGESLHHQYGLTFCETSIFGKSIKTACQENIRTIFGSEAKAWGVEPFRHTGFLPFCGDGILSTDGEKWERSRNLLKPAFLRSNISDLTSFEGLASALLERLPIDGSTVDLDPLLSDMVITPVIPYMIRTLQLID